MKGKERSPGDFCEEPGRLCKKGWEFYRRAIPLVKTFDRDQIIDKLIALALEHPDPMGQPFRGILRILNKFFPGL